MDNTAALGSVWALSLLVTAAGGLLDSVLITSVGVLAFALALTAAFTVWTTDLAEGTRSWAISPDRIEK